MFSDLILQVEIRKFTFSSGNFSLRDVKFELARGEALAVLGPSGAGKSTLLKVVDGLFKDFEGEILLNGKDIRKLTPREIYSQMGLLFQNPEDQLFAETVFEDIAFGPRNMGWSEERVREAVQRALNLVELDGFEERKIETLSFGEKKRVALAGLLAMGQKILLLDEPTLGLDPVLERNFYSLLCNLKSQGVSFVVATHQVDMVPYFADKVLVLVDGKGYLLGSPRDVLTRKNLEDLRLRPPLITQLFQVIEERVSFLPLTVDEGKRLLLELLRDPSSL